MTAYSITCIAPLSKKDELNVAMDALGLPFGLTILLKKAPSDVATHALQHVSGDAAMLAAYQSIGNGLLVHGVAGRPHDQGLTTANEHMAENDMAFMEDPV